MDYVWDVLHTVGITDTPPSSALFPEFYRDIKRDYMNVGNADQAVIGRGTWGVVRKVQKRTLDLRKEKNAPKYACKTVMKERLDNPTLLIREVRNMQRCQDAPHVVKLIDVYEDFYAVHIIMEHCMGMELYEELQLYGDEGLEEEDAAVIIRQALAALAYMHEVCHVAHRDIKASNFMFAHLNLMKQDGMELELKLIDFGFSKHVTDNPLKKVDNSTPLDEDGSTDVPKEVKIGESATAITHIPTMDATDSDDELLKNQHGVMTSEVGTPVYTAPEILTQKTYDFKCDVYSVGVLAYQCLIGKLPIKGKTERDTIKKVMKATTKIDFSDELWFGTDETPKVDSAGGAPKDEKSSTNGKVLSKSARDFCQALLQRDPMHRPTAFEALQMEWMTSRFGEPAELPPAMPDDYFSELNDQQSVATATLEPILSC